ncbi:MAG: spore maturation protein [Bacilli bacterium]|nr:spore maturation protein [Bacilli bacterium]
MVSIIWVFLIVAGIVYGFFTGNIETINSSILTNAKSGLDLIMQILPMLVLWSGLMQIAEDSGLLNKFSNLLYPLLSKLFPSLPKDNPALGYVASNIAANAIGLGSAATPFGLKAMQCMQELNEKKDTATDAMITFLILNTSGVTIIPTTIIAMRSSYESLMPTEIIVTSLIATVCSSFFGLLLDYFIRKRKHY